MWDSQWPGLICFYSAYSKVPYFHLPLESVLLMLWFYTKWPSLHFLLGPRIVAVLTAFRCIIFQACETSMLGRVIAFDLHICSTTDSPSADSWTDAAVEILTHVSSSSKDQYLGHVLPKMLSSWSFWKFQIFLMYTFLQSYYILFSLWYSSTLLSPAFIIYVILKVLPFLV